MMVCDEAGQQQRRVPGLYVLHFVSICWSYTAIEFIQYTVQCATIEPLGLRSAACVT